MRLDFTVLAILLPYFSFDIALSEEIYVLHLILARLNNSKLPYRKSLQMSYYMCTVREILATRNSRKFKRKSLAFRMFRTSEQSVTDHCSNLFWRTAQVRNLALKHNHYAFVQSGSTVRYLTMLTVS